LPVIKQHFVPQFIMRNFADENDLLTIIDKQASPAKLITSKSSAILFENDMYETRNLDGSYYDRNVIENKFAQIEGYISNVLQVIKSNLSDRQKLSPDEEAAFALFIALQLVRIPMVRQIINNSPKGRFTSDADKEIYDKATYRMMLLSRESGFEYLKENGLELSEEAKEQLKGQSLLEYTASFILSECAIYILIAPEENCYLLSDMPVLIDGFSDAKYIFPVAPQIAICCCLFEEASQSEFGGFIQAKREWIEKINELLCDKANRWIICKKGDSSQVLNRLAQKRS
jgi:hypothetical protein